MPPGVVTEIAPFRAPLGTVAVIRESLTTVNAAETPPPNATLVAPVRLLPLIVTVVPTGPELGEIDEIDGAEVAVLTVNDDELVPVPAAVVTAIGPEVAPAGTVAVTVESLLTVNALAAVPLNVTPVAPMKPEPLIVTEVPTGPLGGVKAPTTGAAGVDDEQPGSWNDPIRVCQLSWPSVAGWAS